MGGWLLCALSSLNVVTIFYFFFIFFNVIFGAQNSTFVVFE